MKVQTGRNFCLQSFRAMLFTVLFRERYYFVQVIKKIVRNSHSFARNMSFQTDHICFIGQFEEEEIFGTHSSHV